VSVFGFQSSVLCLCSGKLYSTTSEGENPDSVEERHRHRYEVNPKYVEDIEKAGLRFVGHSTDNTRMEICELHGKENFYNFFFFLILFFVFITCRTPVLCGCPVSPRVSNSSSLSISSLPWPSIGLIWQAPGLAQPRLSIVPKGKLRL